MFLNSVLSWAHVKSKRSGMARRLSRRAARTGSRNSTLGLKRILSSKMMVLLGSFDPPLTGLR